MSDRGGPETFGRADGPWASAPGVRSARSAWSPSRLYVDGKRLVIEDPDTGELNLPVASVDQFAVQATGDPGRIEVVVRIEVRGDGEPPDAGALASHVDAVMRAWQAAVTPDVVGPAPAVEPGRVSGRASVPGSIPAPAPIPDQSDVDRPAPAPALSGPALVPDGPEWIMLGPMADTRSLAYGELFANGAG